MLKIGLTGGIGSGKSLVAEIFKTLQIPVFNADQQAKSLLHTSGTKDQLRKIFGDAIFGLDEIDRKALADVVFSQPDKLALLNEVIHPKVHELFYTFANENASSRFIIYEAAILIETGFYQHLDNLILVTADQELRISRVMKRDNVSRERVVQRMKNQWPDEKKIPVSGFVIRNDENSLLTPQVLTIFDQLIKS